MSISTDDRVQSNGMSDAERERQIKQAEELLFSGPERSGFAKGLFAGAFRGEAIFPYPDLPSEERKRVDAAVAEVREFAEKHIDAAAIDRDADIPKSVIEGLAKLGVLGMTAPVEFGGRGFSQRGYCRVMEVIGGHCSSTAVFVNAHHSIGIRALLLFGTSDQKSKWLGPLVRGEKLAAFALTETEAGSDASNVQTTAIPSEDGKTYILNGTKRYITNGAIADVLTVMAKTPDPRGGEPRVTAFLVTPDLPGFEIVEARMPKCGIRGTATAKLAFHDMAVSAENVLGTVGKGLKVALTVLDFGRTTFGASCAGAAKTCLRAAARHAAKRRQFGRALADLELIKKKIAFLAATAYAIEATTIETAALIDSGAEDYMLETAILKVFSTELLWEAVYETLQVHGGQGYFNDEPFERMMRDARINTIGEGANEVLKAFIALVGMRGVGEGFKTSLERLKRPATMLPTIFKMGADHFSRMAHVPEVRVVSAELEPLARDLATRVSRFGWGVERTLVRYRENVLDRQFEQERIADMAIALYASSCVLARVDDSIARGTADAHEREVATYAVRSAFRRFDRALADLGDEIDSLATKVADSAVARRGD